MYDAVEVCVLTPPLLHIRIVPRTLEKMDVQLYHGEALADGIEVYSILVPKACLHLHVSKNGTLNKILLVRLVCEAKKPL